MSADALAEGVTYQGGGFGAFLDGLEGPRRRERRRQRGPLRGPPLRHGRRRVGAHGDGRRDRGDAGPRPRRVLADGAIGFTSSQLELHVAHDGRGVPSNHAAADELVALASVLGEFGRGSIEFIPRSFLVGYDDDDRALIRAMARAAGRPVHLNTVTSMPHAPDGWSRSVEFAETAAHDGLEIHPMFSSNRQGAHFALGSTFLFDEMPSFRDTLTLPSPDARGAPARPGAARADARGDRGSHRAFVRLRLAGHPAGTGRQARARAVARPVGQRDRGGHRERPARRVPRPLARRGPRRPVRAVGAAHARSGARRRSA